MEIKGPLIGKTSNYHSLNVTVGKYLLDKKSL